MITISVCVGSACHLKGSREVIEGLQRLIKENNVSDMVEIKGAFCVGRCMEAVSVTVNDEGLFSLNESNVDLFFNETIMGSIANE
jgi:NADH:ubiquinone oxidoreductase subunit E